MQLITKFGLQSKRIYNHSMERQVYDIIDLLKETSNLQSCPQLIQNLRVSFKKVVLNSKRGLFYKSSTTKKNQ